MTESAARDREDVPELPNPAGLAGIEFIEYVTDRPQALGQMLEAVGFRPVARHRSREILLYRQGSMNLVVNAHPDDARISATDEGRPVMASVAFRVHDAHRTHQRCLELGAWDAPSNARAMELVIPAIRGPGSARFYFIDRWHDYSVFDIDFSPIPTVDMHPPALAGMGYFGVVQYIGADRSDDWTAYFKTLFGFEPIPDDERFGIMPKGKVMRSPCGTFLWQLVEPDPWMYDTGEERLQRIGIGVPDVPAAVAVLRERGIEFVDAKELHPEDRGALTRPLLGSVAFELVHRNT